MTAFVVRCFLKMLLCLSQGIERSLHMGLVVIISIR
jgi:hypothetical protein